jgi:putative ABC transport system permease protein
VVGRWIETLWQDLRYGWRALRSSRTYAFWVIGSLAIGMAVTIAALALLNAAMVLPFAEVTEQSRLVRIAVNQNCGRPDCWQRISSDADYRVLQEGVRSVRSIAAYSAGEVAVAIPDARSMRALAASPNYFEVLGVRPTLGRAFDAADARTAAAVVVVSHAAWTREFGSDAGVIGRSIRIADLHVQIAGVAPAQFIGIDRIRPGSKAPDVWLPLWLADRVLPLSVEDQRRGHRDVAFVGRLHEGVEVKDVQVEADVLAARLAAARGLRGGGRAEVDRVWRVRPESWQFGIAIVMPIPILVLVIACVNAANLMLARGSQRQRDIAVRLAIGASRGRIVRELLIESAALAAGASAVAIAIAWTGLRAASTPLAEPIPIDATILICTVLTAVATTIAFGLMPALRLTRQHVSNAGRSLAGRSDVLPQQTRMRRILVAAQVAMSLGLLATAWQLVATVRSQAVSAGTPGDHLLIARFDLRPLRLSTGDIERFYRDLVAGATRLPGVEAVGVARHTAVWSFGQRGAPGSLIVWQPTDAPDAGHRTTGGYAAGELFDAVGLHVLAGRTFTESDRLSRPRVAVVNQSFAQRMTTPAVGSVIRVAPADAGFANGLDVRIVGVIEAALEPRRSPDGPPPAKIYLPAPIEPEPALALYVRTRAAATSVAQPVRELVSAIAPRVPIIELGSLAELNEQSFGPQLWLARAAALVGVIGLLLATAGLYGVASYVVAMRSRELAIRMAIGAMPRTILAMILGQSMRIALMGLVIGGGLAAAASRAIQSEYHGILGVDRLAFGGALLLFMAAMLTASAVPAIRASRLDPVENLRDG